jgi:DNA polymerase III delta subunit
VIYLFYGTDREKIIEKTNGIVETLRNKKPDSAFVRIDAESLPTLNIDEYVGGQGLFENKFIVLMDGVIFHKESKLSNTSELKKIAESKNIFIVREGNLLAKDKEKIEKLSEKTQEFSKEDKGKKAEFNVFGITEKILNRDNVGAWMLYREALENGSEPEQLSGIIFWQFKALALASECSNAGEAGLNPFVFNKSKNALKKWPVSDIKTKLTDLLTNYHDSRKEGLELSLALENFLLKI